MTTEPGAKGPLAPRPRGPLAPDAEHEATRARRRPPTEVEEEQEPPLLQRIRHWLFATPPRGIVLSFALLILLGTVLLSMPFASRNGQSIGLSSALFTATSSVCVTGLIVVDTATHWSVWGQLIILLLIQFGGLGLVTLTSFFFMATRRRIGMRSMLAVHESMGTDAFVDTRRMVVRIVAITLSIEALGALILTWRFARYLPLPQAAWRGVFHGISAFCNAGFDLMGNVTGPFSSMTAWNDDPIVLITLGCLLAMGGLGFVVWNDLLFLPGGLLGSRSEEARGFKGFVRRVRPLSFLRYRRHELSFAARARAARQQVELRDLTPDDGSGRAPVATDGVAHAPEGADSVLPAEASHRLRFHTRLVLSLTRADRHRGDRDPCPRVAQSGAPGPRPCP